MRNSQQTRLSGPLGTQRQHSASWKNLCAWRPSCSVYSHGCMFTSQALHVQRLQSVPICPGRDFFYLATPCRSLWQCHDRCVGNKGLPRPTGASSISHASLADICATARAPLCRYDMPQMCRCAAAATVQDKFGKTPLVVAAEVWLGCRTPARHCPSARHWPAPSKRIARERARTRFTSGFGPLSRRAGQGGHLNIMVYLAQHTSAHVSELARTSTGPVPAYHDHDMTHVAMSAGRTGDVGTALSRGAQLPARLETVHGVADRPDRPCGRPCGMPYGLAFPSRDPAGPEDDVCLLLCSVFT